MKKPTKVFVFITFLCLFSCCSQYSKEQEKARTKNTEEAIKKNPQLQRLDKLCKELPLVKDFTLVAKDKSHRNPPKLFLYYYSDTDFSIADAEFKKYFAKNGWEPIEISPGIREYGNNKFVINIQYGGMGSDSNYGISCGERES